MKTLRSMTLGWSIISALILSTNALADNVATVNGEAISRETWVRRMELLRFNDFVQSNQPLRFKPVNGGQIALEMLINARLVMQYAAKVEAISSDKEVNAEFDILKSQPAIVQALTNKSIIEDELRNDIRVQQTLYNVATVNKSVTEPEMREYFEKHQDQYGRPEQWTLSIIRCHGLAKVDAVQAALKKGDNWETVAASLSDDPNTRARSGLLGTVAPNDPGIPPYIRDAAKDLPESKTAGPIKSEMVVQGQPVLFFLKMIKRTAPIKVEFIAVADKVRRAALFEKVAFGTNRVAELRAAATIEISLPGYQALAHKP